MKAMNKTKTFTHELNHDERRSMYNDFFCQGLNDLSLVYPFKGQVRKECIGAIHNRQMPKS